MADRVAILGGGIGGLSAAHELAERGFKVDVYERRTIFGGKARSIPVPNSAIEGRKLLPGEHGFRFFPSFYRHIPDTMSRIPFRDNPRGVLDNLVPTTRMIIARAGAPSMLLCSRFPQNRDDWRVAGRSVFGFLGVVSAFDILYYFKRLLVWLTSCDERRTREYEYVPWWQFTRAESRSEGYRQFFGQGFTRQMVAIRAEESSTRTVGAIGLQLGLGYLSRGVDADSVLNGPTNDMWIDPWVEHLKSLGVAFHSRAIVQQIRTDGKRITHAIIEQDGRTLDVTADYFVAALPVEVMTTLLTDELKRAAPSMARIGRLRTAWMNGIQFYLARHAPIVHGHIMYCDSPWALTSVSQDQFWTSIDLTDYGDGEVKGIISVDISDWETPGLLYAKPARECDAVEIKNEVWLQIMAHLNADGQRQLKDARIMRWFLDPSIVFPNPSKAVNLEPLLINTAGSLADRPEAYTEIPNLFLAADYVRTETDLASMEAANEAARRAVNALLDAAASPAPRAALWPLREPSVFNPWKKWDRLLFEQGKQHSWPQAVWAAMRRWLPGGRQPGEPSAA
ncbi:MAG TPA: FAD-dependent oxidoreductase [Vicinamibacterales bacterium]